MNENKTMEAVDTENTETYIDETQAKALKEQLSTLTNQDIRAVKIQRFRKEQDRIQKQRKVKAKAKRKAQKTARRRMRMHRK